MEAIYWILIPVVLIGGLALSAGIYETFFLDTPFAQAEWRRKANERFGRLIGGEK